MRQHNLHNLIIIKYSLRYHRIFWIWQEIRHFTFRLNVAKTTSRQKATLSDVVGNVLGCKQNAFPLMSPKFQSSILLFFALNVNKGRTLLLQFFLNLSWISWKEIPGLYLHLPIFIFAYLPFTYNNSRFSLFAYFYIRNNRMSK